MLRSMSRHDLLSLTAVLLLIPVMAVAIVPNNQIFNAYLVWGDARFDLLGLPSSWLVTIDAIVSVSFLLIVALFYRWYGKHRREPDELGKIIIGSLFSVGGMLCLAAAATTPATAKISLFWPMMFELLNSIAFAHMLPVSLALFARLAPRQVHATTIGLYYLAFFGANSLVGWIGGWYATMDTTQFWLLHAGLAGGAGAAFVLFKFALAPVLMKPEAIPGTS
jgi:POT family proton-dependent oligopeptide transporter